MGQIVYVRPGVCGIWQNPSPAEEHVEMVRLNRANSVTRLFIAKAEKNQIASVRLMRIVGRAGCAQFWKPTVVLSSAKLKAPTRQVLRVEIMMLPMEKHVMMEIPLQVMDATRVVCTRGRAQHLPSVGMELLNQVNHVKKRKMDHGLRQDAAHPPVFMLEQILATIQKD
jgi:hypothetical protein